MRTVSEFASMFDLALHNQAAGKDEVMSYVQIARDRQVSALYTNPYWSPMVAKELEGSGVRAGGALGFPFGAYTTKSKLYETEQLLEAGCTTMDMVVNIGEVKDGNWDFVTDEISRFNTMCHDAGAWSKLIFEVCFLNQDEIARLTQICSELGYDYVKTATGSEAFPDLEDVQTMQANLSGDTKIKVSGVPRTFAMAAALFLFDNFDVRLVGTRSAGKLIDQYAAYRKSKGEE